MAERTLVLHILTVGGIKVGIKEPDLYSAIADIVGVKKAADTDKVDDSGSISELKLRGKAITLNAFCSDKKRHKIQCSIDKVTGAVAGLIGKSFGANTIKSVSIPRRRTRR